MTHTVGVVKKIVGPFARGLSFMSDAIIVGTVVLMERDNLQQRRQLKRTLKSMSRTLSMFIDPESYSNDTLLTMTHDRS